MRALVLFLLLMGCDDGGEGVDTGDVDTGGGDTAQDSDDDTDPVDNRDRDGDGYPGSTDCDDTRADINPAVATDDCNGLDDDCDGEVDEDPDLEWFIDDDLDGFGKAGGGSFVSCDGGAGFASNDADCDDDVATVYPGAEDPCDEVDNDCDGTVDGDPSTWTAWNADLDGDGAGTADDFVYACFLPADGAENDWDCDDADAHEPVFADPAGSSRGSGTLTSPISSLQTAIDASELCVVAFGGTYDEDVDFNGKSVDVIGVEGSQATILKGTGRGSVVTVDQGETVSLKGLWIQGGTGAYSSSSYTDGYYYYYYDYYYGGGLYVSGSTVALEDVFASGNGVSESCDWVSSTTYQCTQAMGGAIYGSGADLSLTDVQILENMATSGSALYLQSTALTGERVVIAGNKDSSYTVYVYNGTFDVDAFIMNANKSSYSQSGLYAYAGQITLQNATIVDNDYCIYLDYSRLDLDSSIVASCTYGVLDPSASSTTSFTYNDVYGNDYGDYYNITDPTGRDGNVSMDPRFSRFSADGDAAPDDLHLSSTSPLVDAGNPSDQRYDSDGTRNDMGAFGGPEGSW